MFSSNRIQSCAMRMTKGSKRASYQKVCSCCKWEHLLCTSFAKEWNVFSFLTYLYCTQIEWDSALAGLENASFIPLSQEGSLPTMEMPPLGKTACNSTSSIAETPCGSNTPRDECFTPASSQVPFSLRVTDFGTWPNNLQATACKWSLGNPHTAAFQCWALS